MVISIQLNFTRRCSRQPYTSRPVGLKNQQFYGPYSYETDTVRYGAHPYQHRVQAFYSIYPWSVLRERPSALDQAHCTCRYADVSWFVGRLFHFKCRLIFPPCGELHVGPECYKTNRTRQAFSYIHPTMQMLLVLQVLAAAAVPALAQITTFAVIGCTGATSVAPCDGSCHSFVGKNAFRVCLCPRYRNHKVSDAGVCVGYCRLGALCHRVR
jgi:hypothetical protein